MGCSLDEDELGRVAAVAEASLVVDAVDAVDVVVDEVHVHTAVDVVVDVVDAVDAVVVDRSSGMVRLLLKKTSIESHRMTFWEKGFLVVEVVVVVDVADVAIDVSRLCKRDSRDEKKIDPTPPSFHPFLILSAPLSIRTNRCRCVWISFCFDV